jgi:sugar (pentulose or hexulose) kinase
MSSSGDNSSPKVPLILCADIGTSSLKAALISIDGHEEAFSRIPYEKVPGSTVLAGEWEAAFARALGELLPRAGAAPAGICISGNGPTLVPVTASDEALAPLYWYEGPQGSTAPHKEGSAIRSFYLPHVVRFLKERPREYAQTRRLFSVQEWLSWRLGADAVTVLSAPAYKPFYWDAEQIARLGLDGTMLPSFAEMGSVIGRLSPAAAFRLGSLGGFDEAALPAGIPILAGGPDFIMALIGVGAIKPGMVCDRAGTSEGINYCSDFRPESAVLRVLPHITEGYWNVSAVLPSSGKYFEWYKALTGQKSRDYEDLLHELIIPGAAFPNGFFFLNASSSGGNDSCSGFTFLTRRSITDTDRISMGRTILEAIGFLVKGCLETLRSQGFPVNEMRLSGGQSKNRRWNQLKADITGTGLLVPEISDGELAGNAVLGALALGEVADLAEGTGRIVHIRECFVPSPQSAAYGERFYAYRELGEKIRTDFSGML